DGRAETIFSAWHDDSKLAPLRLGLCGIDRELTVKPTPVEGRSPQDWRGPAVAAGEQLWILVPNHSGMGTGGILWRRGESLPWTSLAASSQWGAERLKVPETWSGGHDRANATRNVFRGSDLQAKWHSQIVPLT